MQHHPGLEKVSIVMPVKDASKWLEKSITNLVEVALDTAEIVVIDDNSTDDTLSMSKQYEKKHSNLKVVRNKGSGIVDALNIGVASSSGEWIARADVDDCYSENRLQLQLKLINSETAVIFSDYKFIDLNGKFLGNVPSPIFSDATKLSLVSGNRTAHPSAVFSKRAFEEVGGYLNKSTSVEDLCLWLRMSQIGEFASAPTQLLSYRLSSNSVTIKRRKQLGILKEKLLREVRLDREILDNSISNFKSTMDSYQAFPDARLRSLLHINDLCRSQKYFPDTVQYRKVIFEVKHLISTQTILCLGEALFWSQKRSIYRKSLAYPNGSSCLKGRE